MLKALAERERGALAWADGAAAAAAAAAASHRPHRFHAAALGDAGLARRLGQTTALTGHSGGISALAWGEGGELLASGGEDCRLRLWRASSGELLHSLDTGHTSAVLGTCFLPGRADQLLCCSADRQIRHLNVTKGAVRPYLVHSDRVRAVVPLDTHLFLSASEDGTVREFDVRQRPAAVHRDALAGDDSNVLVDQRGERVGHARVRVGIYSLSVDEQRPWLMLTGGADPLLRLYDRRMLVTAGGEDGTAGGRRAQQWVACFVPSHLKAAVWDSGRHPVLAAPSAPALPGRHVTAVAFARGGAEVVGSYAGEAIYSFDVATHARDVEALLHIPDTVLRQPGRPRSHAGRRSMHAYASSQEHHRPAAGRMGDAEIAATAEGGGGTAPAPAEQLGAAAQAAAAGGQLQQRQRAAPGRGMAVAPSVRQLALQQRRQLSRIAATDAGEPPRAESSRPAHWQMHPTSSTLRSPLYEVRQLHATLRQRQQVQLGAGAGLQLEQQAQHEVGSDSEAPSEGVSREGQPAQQGVRRSRRIMRRRRDAAEQEQLQQHDAAAADGADQAACAAAEEELQQPAVSGVAEAAAGLHSCSDSEQHALASPTTRRGVRRRTGTGAVGADHAPAQQQADFGGAAAAAAEGSGGGGGFKAPAGRSPQQRRQAAAAAAAMHRLDSTVGLLYHHPLQQEASEVAARGAGQQQEATVSQRQPGAAGAHWPPERSLAAEVNSRPVLSASQVGLATQLGSQEAGHEASSLNSAEQPANERVGSVAQHGRTDAPSVGNAPLATTAAAGGRPRGACAATAEQQDQQQRQQQAAADGREASTGHWLPRASADRVVPPPPQFATAAAQQQGQLPHGTRQRGQLQPTASTGTSRPVIPSHPQHTQQRHMPPAASGRLASRLRRHSEAEGGAAAAAAGAGPLGSSQAAEVPAEAVEQQQQVTQHAGPASAGVQGQAAPSLLQPQPTMLSGRGPSVLGDFMPPGQDPPVDSAEIEQQQDGAGGTGDQRGAAQQQAQAGTQAGAQQAGRQPPRRRQVDSNVGAIVMGEEAEGEEVSEPLMYRRCYAGHLNLSGLAGGDAVPLAPPLAFLGSHSELLVSPSDDGNLFVWDYATASLAAVLAPPAAAQPTLSTAGSPGEAAALSAAAAATCVAAHPLLPVLASGGSDSVVRLWSPEAEEAASMEFAAAAAQANLQRLAAAGMQPPGGGGPLPAAWQGRPLDCRAM